MVMQPVSRSSLFNSRMSLYAYGTDITGLPGEVCLKVDVRKNKDAARLHEMLCSWQQAAAMLEAGEISKEDYDKWRYRYPEFDKAQNYVKVPPQDLF